MSSVTPPPAADHQPMAQPGPTSANGGPRPSSGRVTVAVGIVLAVMAAASFASIGLVTVLARDVGGTGEGEGEVGQVKIYMTNLAEGAFLSLFVILLAGALTAFAAAVVLFRRDRA